MFFQQPLFGTATTQSGSLFGQTQTTSAFGGFGGFGTNTQTVSISNNNAFLLCSNIWMNCFNGDNAFDLINLI